MQSIHGADRVAQRSGHAHHASIRWECHPRASWARAFFWWVYACPRQSTCLRRAPCHPRRRALCGNTCGINCRWTAPASARQTVDGRPAGAGGRGRQFCRTFSWGPGSWALRQPWPYAGSQVGALSSGTAWLSMECWVPLGGPVASRQNGNR